jgi:hypothetical protein
LNDLPALLSLDARHSALIPYANKQMIGGEHGVVDFFCSQRRVHNQRQ